MKTGFIPSQIEVTKSSERRIRDEHSGDELPELKKNAKKAPKLGSYRSAGLTSKMWITPAGEFEKVPHMHYWWIQAHEPKLPKKIPAVPGVQDEDTLIRLWALSRGYVRVNYELNGGRLTLEVSEKHWGRRIKDAYFMLAAENVAKLDNVTVRLLDSKGKMVKSGEAALFRYDDKEKLDHLPMLEAARIKILKELL